MIAYIAMTMAMMANAFVTPGTALHNAPRSCKHRHSIDSSAPQFSGTNRKESEAHMALSGQNQAHLASDSMIARKLATLLNKPAGEQQHAIYK
jgi:hypothetical protein